MLQQILDAFPDEQFLLADGFNEAIIAVEPSSMRLIYSISKCIEILREDMSHEEAIEHFEFNVQNSYVGEKTPIWSYDSDHFEQL